jgi:hypothetical protein
LNTIGPVWTMFLWPIQDIPSQTNLLNLQPNPFANFFFGTI